MTQQRIQKQKARQRPAGDEEPDAVPVEVNHISREVSSAAQEVLDRITEPQ